MRVHLRFLKSQPNHPIFRRRRCSGKCAFNLSSRGVFGYVLFHLAGDDNEGAQFTAASVEEILDDAKTELALA